MPESRKKPEHNIQATMSILNWVPDLDEIQAKLTGTVPRSKDDVVKSGDVNDRKNS